jgi:hypothetical protein
MKLPGTPHQASERHHRDRFLLAASLANAAAPAGGWVDTKNAVLALAVHGQGVKGAALHTEATAGAALVVDSSHGHRRGQSAAVSSLSAARMGRQHRV